MSLSRTPNAAARRPSQVVAESASFLAPVGGKTSACVRQAVVNAQESGGVAGIALIDLGLRKKRETFGLNASIRRAGAAFHGKEGELAFEARG